MESPDTAAVRARETWFIPAAIVIAGLILAVAVYAMRSGRVEGAVEGDISLLHPVTEADHIAGNPAAPVVLVEYADIDSSYAKSFQQTLEQVMADYGENGQVAWVYRHLPLIDQHVHAAEHAEAAECVASLGGPASFWRFIDAVNGAAPDSQQFDPDGYDSIVSGLGLLPQSFEACMSAHTYQQKVASDFENGIAVGAGGSPFTVLLVKGQQPVTIDGAVPYDALKKMLDAAVQKAQAADPAETE